VIPLVPTTGSVARPPGASTERAGYHPQLLKSALLQRHGAAQATATDLRLRNHGL